MATRWDGAVARGVTCVFKPPTVPFKIGRGIILASPGLDFAGKLPNIADLPSRGAVHELLHALRGVPLAARARTDLRVPHVGHWAAPLESWVLRFLHLNGTWPA